MSNIYISTPLFHLFQILPYSSQPSLPNGAFLCTILLAPWKIPPQQNTIKSYRVHSVFGVAFIYTSDLLGLDNLSGGLSLEKTDSPISQQPLIGCSSSSKGVVV